MALPLILTATLFTLVPHSLTSDWIFSDGESVSHVVIPWRQYVRLVKDATAPASIREQRGPARYPQASGSAGESIQCRY